MAKILIIRLSSIGDVAMTIPVIYSVAQAYPADSFTILTQTYLIPVFINRPSNVNVLGINTKAAEKRISGLIKFGSALVKYNYDMVIDLHSVTRTKIIRSFFRLKRMPVYVIDRNSKARKRLTRQKNKEFKQLRSVSESYANTFRNAGFQFTDTFTTLFDKEPPNLKRIQEITGEKKGHWIGIAPFAKHRGKIYPIDYMEKVVELLTQREDITLFLFGGRGYEEAVLEEWAYHYPRVKSVVGRYSLDSELALISQLDLLLCMDSANMHFASLVGTKVVSIWGATHPYAGFYGYRQNPDHAIQLDLSCRPCSVYGQKNCLRGDWACMTRLLPEMIAEKVREVLENKTDK
ncbi:glycosyltransferase family 9 protein [Parabacteroides sp. OttesenSCG-928-K15]|nr:glycosyltransferase family 9 protein [Parabacteroides sp. OttesenSCG-928-K15]